MTFKSSELKVMIMAGGTGGHVFPALAVAEELLHRGCSVEWFGTRSGIEAELVPARHLPIHYLSIRGVRGKGIGAFLLAPVRIVSAIWQAVRLLRRSRPGVVLGMGGYASGPGGIAAKILGMPLVVHEQNAKPGTTNKWLARVATRVLTAFPNVFPTGECIGNPVRAEIAAIPHPEQRLKNREDSFRLLVLGGSLGAQAINELLPKVLSGLVRSHSIDVIHQTGKRHFDLTLSHYQKCGVEAKIVPFIDDMAGVLEWADLVVCRSGALTVSELSAAGVASILVPFPYAIDDHQTANAMWLVQAGAAIVRQQAQLSPDELATYIRDFVEHRERVYEMAVAARSVAITDSAQQCANICMEVGRV